MTEQALHIALLERQALILARRLDPYMWEQQLNSAYAEAIKELADEQKDMRTTPSIRATTVVAWKPPGCDVERMGIR